MSNKISAQNETNLFDRQDENMIIYVESFNVPQQNVSVMPISNRRLFN